MSRKTAREHAFRILFSMQFAGKETPDIPYRMERYFAESLDGQNDPDEADRRFMLAEMTGTGAHKSEIDSLIESALTEWKLSRLPFVDLTLMEMAVHEMFFMKDMPVSVSINEAVELAKKYSSEQSPAFINGVLGTLADRLEGKVRPRKKRAEAQEEVAEPAAPEEAPVQETAPESVSAEPGREEPAGNGASAPVTEETVAATDGASGTAEAPEVSG